MTLKAWSSTLLILCFSFAAWAQKGNSYLEKPLPQGWGTGTVYIALFWIMPYMEMSMVAFYRDLDGELDYRLPEDRTI